MQEMSESHRSISLQDWVTLPAVRTLLKRDGFVDFKVTAVGAPSGVSSTGQDFSDTIGRLKDLGFVAGEVGRFVAQAPFGEPLYIEIADTIIALRNNEALLISVQSRESGVRLEKDV